MCLLSVVLATLYSYRSNQMDQELRISIFGLSLVFLAPALGGFLFGYDIGSTAFVLEELRHGCPTQPTHVAPYSCWWKEFHKSSLQQGLFVSAVSLGALLGSHLVYMHIGDRMGRRAEIRACAVLYLVGTLVEVLSGSVLQDAPLCIGFSCLILGRLVYGEGVAFIMHAAPAYLAEMCPPTVRGGVVAAKETVIVIGILVGYACGNLFFSWKWIYLYALTILGSVPMLLLSWFVIPRSKRWLLLKGRKQEALESMQFVYCGNVEHEFQLLASDIIAEPNNSGTCSTPNTVSKTATEEPTIFDKQHQSSFICSFGLILLQQCSGQPSILSYTTVLFSAAGLTGSSSVATALYMILNSIYTVVMVDQVGRRNMLQRGCFLMMTSLLVLATCFWNYDSGNGQEYYFGTPRQVVILLSMFLYIGAYQLGFGPITWLVVSEVWPVQLRGKAIAFGVELNFLLNFLVQFLFPSLQQVLGWGGTFLLFASVLMFAIYFCSHNIPETTGLTLEEIQHSLRSKGDGIVMMDETSNLLQDDVVVVPAIVA